jgi:cellulose synthase/poly-beta-1,6-N-acetylglucosamine synthase-like glycosyltransferase
MNRAIAPITDTLSRPFWSVMIPTYNPKPEHLRQTLQAVLEQDPGPDAMEIVVIDDASSGVEARNRPDGVGRNRMAWFRQDRHVAVAMQSRRYYTDYAVVMAWRALLQREFSASLAQIREARKLTSTTSVMMAIGTTLPDALRVRSGRGRQRTVEGPELQCSARHRR